MATQTNLIHKNTEDKLSLVLLEQSLLSLHALQTLQKKAAAHQQTLFQYLMQHQCVDPTLLQNACAQFFHLQKIKLESQTLHTQYIHKSLEQSKRFILMLPVSKKSNRLIIAISNPNDLVASNNLSFQWGIQIEIQMARYDALYRLHNHAMTQHIYNQSNQSDLIPEITHTLFSDAIHRGASDIHIEPYQHHLRVRFRMDGLLHEILTLPIGATDRMISCIKILAQLDIAIKRMPQDGRLTFHSYLGFVKDCRVSTCPTIHGEKMVIRLLDADAHIRSMNVLGLTKSNQQIIEDAIQKPQGLILVTGPTGSGKTMTLYTLLHMLNQTHRNIATIEDPVEMQMEGINQTAVLTKTGLTFSFILRTLLRQDPDVIMVGEIRDLETAEMALRAAQTGHLVLSTLHTNSAIDAVTRLIQMGIAPFHLSSALTLIIAQRLTRKLCVHCKKLCMFSLETYHDAGFQDFSIDRQTFFQAEGCAQCIQGFSGRIGVFELLPMTVSFQQFVLNHTVQHQATQKNLWQAGLSLVTSGMTSLEEIYRVIPRGVV